MEAISHPIILHVYEITPPTNVNDASASKVSFISRLLTPIGFGTYHTSLEVFGYCYTFSANAGIQKSSSTNKSSHEPPGVKFKESITVASLSENIDQQVINECTNRLRRSFFTGSSYHLACRNCNHFTETFATCLVMADEMMSGSEDQQQMTTKSPLKNYPKWVNRLAKSGSGIMDHNDKCDIMKEATIAAGTEGKVGWSLTSTPSVASGSKNQQDKKKKTLTEKQKKALAKLRKK